jgi:hypothetical protein
MLDYRGGLLQCTGTVSGVLIAVVLIIFLLPAEHQRLSCQKSVLSFEGCSCSWTKALRPCSIMFRGVSGEIQKVFCFLDYSLSLGNGVRYCIMQCSPRDILVRIRILGSIPLTNGSESSSGSCSFRRWHSRRQQKIISNILRVHLHHSSKIKKSHKEVTKESRIRDAQILTVPDPEHWHNVYSSCRVRSLHFKPVPADQYYWITDPYPDPARFFSVFKIPTKIFFPRIFCLLLSY